MEPVGWRRRTELIPVSSSISLDFCGKCFKRGHAPVSSARNESKSNYTDESKLGQRRKIANVTVDLVTQSI